MPLVTISLKLDEVLVKELECIARKMGVTRSDVIRDAIRRYLQELKAQGVDTYILSKKIKIRKVSLR